MELNKLILSELKDIKRALTCNLNTDNCCPITNSLLQDINDNLSELDVSIDNLVLNTDTLEINTDEIELMLTNVIGFLTNILSILQNENDETQIILNDIKTNIFQLEIILNDIKTVLNAPCGDPNVQNVNICQLPVDPTYDTFQIKDCEGNNIGTLQDVQKTVVLNNISAKICNIEELSDALYIQDKEIVYTPSTKFHIGTDNYYSREKIIYDSHTQSEVSRVIEYSTDGVTFTTTAPIGTPLIGWYEVPISEYNTEDEILLTAGNSFVINTNEVHSYSISVLGNGTASTIQIGANIPLPITNGYHKQMEFTNLNTQQVTITCGLGDEIRIILTKI